MAEEEPIDLEGRPSEKALEAVGEILNGTRQKQEREWHRQFILERAVKEFAERGYEGTTMDRIAEAAEVSKGTLYNYFSSKQEIFFSILHYGMDQVLEIIDRALEVEISIEEKVGILTSQFLDFFEEGREIHGILMFESERIMMAAHMDLGEMMREHIAAFISLTEINSEASTLLGPFLLTVSAPLRKS